MNLKLLPDFFNVLVVLAVAGMPGLVRADAGGNPPVTLSIKPQDTHRWQASMAAFAAADREKLPGSDGVLFVGSSTIRFWTTMASDFRDVPVLINRGFGGSTMAECEQLAKELVTRYRPRQVLVYAGDNDLAEGRTPQQVLSSFTSFVQTVRSELPNTRIAYISIKPSPSRAALLPRIREANDLLAAHVKTLGNAEFIDVFTPMLSADGKPRPELFKADQLHMNDAGYALWHSVIAPRVSPALRAGPAVISVKPGTSEVVTPGGLRLPATSLSR